MTFPRPVTGGGNETSMKKVVFWLWLAGESVAIWFGTIGGSAPVFNIAKLSIAWGCLTAGVVLFAGLVLMFLPDAFKSKVTEEIAAMQSAIKKRGVALLITRLVNVANACLLAAYGLFFWAGLIMFQIAAALFFRTALEARGEVIRDADGRGCGQVLREP